MAQDIEKKYGFNIKGELKRTVPRIFRYDAGPNVGTLRKKPKKTVKKKTRSGNIGNIDMEGFKSVNTIAGQSDFIGKKMSPSRNKLKVKNEKEDSLLSKIYKGLSTKSTSFDPTKTGLGGAKFAQRNQGGPAPKTGKQPLSGGPAPKTGKRPLSAEGVKIINAATMLAKQREKGGRVTQADIDLAKKMLRIKKEIGIDKAGSTVKKKKGGVIKAGLGKAIISGIKQIAKGKRKSSLPRSKELEKFELGMDKYLGQTVAKKRYKGKKIGKITSDAAKVTAGVGLGAAAEKRKKSKTVKNKDKKSKGGMNKYNKGSMLGDLDKDGVMSGYEQKRQDAITTAMGNKKMSGGMAKKKMMGGGMMQYSKGTGKKGVTVQARGCGLARKKPTKMS